MVTKNPIADMQRNVAPIDRANLEREFVEALRGRWARGARDYGDASFHAAPDATVAEILAEVLDIGGWSFVLWVSLRMRLQAVTDNATTMQHLQARAVAAEGERDVLRRQLAEVRQTLAAAPECPTWAALAGLVAKATRLAAEEGRS